MNARTKRRITEAIISLFCLAVLVFTFRIFVIPASRGEKVRFRFIWFDPDTMAEHEPAMDGAPASFPPPHTATRTMPGASGDAAPRGRSSGLPAILAGLKLPDDPEDLPKVLLPRNISLFRVLRRACPGDNEWVASGLDALERHARSDTAVRKELSTVYGPRCGSCDGPGDHEDQRAPRPRHRVGLDGPLDSIHAGDPVWQPG